jgi:plastocyanin
MTRCGIPFNTSALGAAVSVVMLLATLGCRPSDPRDVLLVANDMTFTLPSEPDMANPVIRLTAGDRIRLTLRNDAHGLLHDFQIPAWNVKTDQIRAGQSTTVMFVVPSGEGRFEYICGPHSTLMHGFVEVSSE